MKCFLCHKLTYINPCVTCKRVYSRDFIARHRPPEFGNSSDLSDLSESDFSEEDFFEATYLMQVHNQVNYANLGLNFQQIQDISTRELTPEDYELLLRLDSGLPKSTVARGKLDSLEEMYFHGGGMTECAICMCSFEHNDNLKRLPCSHSFHSACVTTWLVKHSNSCPLCKTVVA